MTKEPKPVTDIVERAHPRPVRRLDHHRPHLARRQHPGGLARRQVPASSTRSRVADFNQYGTRRGNHEVMMRGTFANIRIKNQMVKDATGNVVEGGFTLHSARRASGCRSTTPPCATRRRACRSSCFAGKEYGTGSSRDWAAKGTNLLGVRAVIAESFERIHRSNLVGMGVVPLVFEGDTSWRSPRPEGRRDRHDPRPRRRPQAAPAARRRDHVSADGSVQEVSARLPDRYARRARIFPQRRHPALRPAPARGVNRLTSQQIG